MVISNLTDQLTISIPTDLARHLVWQRKKVNQYQTNQLIKAMDTWLLLKHCTTSGIIQNWNEQKQDLFRLCKCSESIFRHRLKLLADLQLLKYNRYNINICSWQILEKTFEIDTSAKFTIQYNLNDKQRIQEWFIATEIKDNQSRQAYMIIKKLNKNPDHYIAAIGAILAAGADATRLKEPGYILTWLQIVYRQDFIQASKIHDLMIELRPDTNRGVKKMAAEWKCKHPMTVTYWKRSLQQCGIIDISKLQIESSERVRNKECKVLWLKKTAQTMLCLCDQITVLEPWTIKNFLLAA